MSEHPNAYWRRTRALPVELLNPDVTLAKLSGMAVKTGLEDRRLAPLLKIQTPCARNDPNEGTD